MRSRLPPTTHPHYDDIYRQEAQLLGDFTEDLLENALHSFTAGPRHLDRADIRTTVLDSWLYLEREGTVQLHALCVMSNHVHTVVAAPPTSKPVDIGRLMLRHKSYTAVKCNGQLGRQGQGFWAANYFDRTIRTGAWLTTMWYVINNPVKARLVRHWQEWPGTYVSPRYIDHFL